MGRFVMISEEHKANACICDTWREETPFGFSTLIGADATCLVHGEEPLPAAAPNPRSGMLERLTRSGFGGRSGTGGTGGDMERINARRALELLTDVVDAYGEGTVYAKMACFCSDRGCDETLVCTYAYEGEPSCMVGHALIRAGATVGQLEELDRNGGGAGMLDDPNLSPIWGNVTRGAVGVFFAAQVRQDQGDTWGSALAAAREHYEGLGDE